MGALHMPKSASLSFDSQHSCETGFVRQEKGRKSQANYTDSSGECINCSPVDRGGSGAELSAWLLAFGRPNDMPRDGKAPVSFRCNCACDPEQRNRVGGVDNGIASPLEQPAPS
eukprot:scaffold64_cov338-Pavlova_lutheri.AAC.83